MEAANVIAALNKENNDMVLNKILAVINCIVVEKFMDAESFPSMEFDTDLVADVPVLMVHPACRFTIVITAVKTASVTQHDKTILCGGP